MKRFTELYAALDRTTRTTEKVAALRDYFAEAPPEDAAWALAFLTGRRFRRPISSKTLRAWAAEAAGLPAWLVDESYAAVGDLSETLALLLPEPEDAVDLPLHRIVAERVEPLRDLPDAERRARVEQTWRELARDERYLWHKLVLGGFRVGAATKLVTRALAEAADVEPAVMAHRLIGQWTPTATQFEAFIAPAHESDDPVRPYPFALASPLEAEPASLGPIDDWRFEWKWDGVRAQLIRRAGRTVVWSRGEELITDTFPELRGVGDLLPDGVVLDGEILAWDDDAPLSFHDLQRRLGRRNVEPMLFADTPIVFQAFDLLERDGEDWRERGFDERRAALEQIVLDAADDALRLSTRLTPASWDDAAVRQRDARRMRTEGLMIKRASSTYHVGRVRGDWWKWKVDPYTIDAVLINALPGSGRRASLYTDYTFAVWDGDELTPIARAYSGLTDAEIREVDQYVRTATVSRHGPVRVVRPERVFELAFEGVQTSPRHRSGVALRFPRIHRARPDKSAREADTIDALRSLIDGRTTS